MALGDPILTQGVISELAATLALDHRNAASLAIAAYLNNASFVLAGDAPEAIEEPSIAHDVPFKLDKTTHVWPSGKTQITYPSASIIEVGNPKYTQDLSQRPIDETWDQYGEGTVLWHIKEALITFQVDFWTNTDPMRESIAAHLEQVFNPEEIRTGVMLEGPKEYFCCPIRVTLDEVMRIDNSESSLTRERRLKTTMIADIPVLQLRRAVALTPQIIPKEET